MVLIKLDSGDYINTEYVTAIYTVTQPWDGKTCSLEMVNVADGAMLYITDADRDHIMEAMNGTPLHITADTIFDACCIPEWAITKGHGEMLWPVTTYTDHKSVLLVAASIYTTS
jgi:hypothetical protein